MPTRAQPTPAERPDPAQIGIPSNLTGSIPGGYTPAYGGAPIIPNPIASAWQAYGGDTQGFPDLSNLASMYNLANYNTQAGEVSGTPGFSSVDALLHGQLPQDVINQIAQGAAERGVAGGSPDSPNANAAYLSALGLNSMQAQQLGQSEYGSLLGHFPMAAPFDMQSFMVTPEQQQAANTAANVSAAAPNPQQAAQAELQALLQSIAAGKGATPIPGPVGVAPAPALYPTNGTTPGGGYAGGPATTTGTTTVSPVRPIDQITQAAQDYGSVPSGPPWTNQTGTSTAAVDAIQQSLLGASPGGLPYPGGGVLPSGPGGGSDWWNATAPWDALSSIDWAAPTGVPADSQSSNWWEAPDPWSALSNIDWGQPTGGPSSTPADTYGYEQGYGQMPQYDPTTDPNSPYYIPPDQSSAYDTSGYYDGGGP